MAKLIPSHISFQELHDIIELVENVSGFNLKGYSQSSLKRRIQRVMDLQKMDIVDLKSAIINTAGFNSYFMNEITVNVTEMFRDPLYYAALRSDVMPYLATFPRLKCWSAGCSSGEEVYSLAIILQESGLYNRSFIYGTDVNTTVLETAKKAIYPLKLLRQYTENYNATSADHSLSNYYTAMYDAAIIHADVRKNTLFSQHNLTTDRVFNEFQFISCRNVLIYFNLELQKQIFQLFYDSLSKFGFLCLGTKETLFNHEIMSKFKVINKRFNIYQKIK